MSESRNVIFLPGVSGDGGFWKGVGGLLPAAWNKRYLDWPDLGRQFAKVMAPTLLLWGDDDPLSPVAIGRRLAAAIPKAALQIIPAGRHSMGADLPQLLAPRIEAHIAGV